MKRLLLGLTLLLLNSCTVYSSVGRKDFESKSPDYIKTQSFLGCEPLETQEMTPEFYESFAGRSIFSSDNFWVATDEKTVDQQPRWVQVLDHKNDQICNYEFATEQDWSDNKEYFLQHLP